MRRSYMSGTLYIVATPIGNLEDITLRALRILKEVQAVVAEDTRRTRQLLSHFQISNELISYFEYSKQRRADYLIERLKNGDNLALVSDAGTPTLSDPGARLVAQAHEEGIPVIPVPGPSAFLSAVSVAGYPTDPLHFWGFLSPSRSKRKKVYRKIMESDGLHCFYESPHKIVRNTEEWKEHLPGTYFFVAREITKKFEEFTRGTVDDVAAQIAAAEPRGEYTILVAKEEFSKKE